MLMIYTDNDTLIHLKDVNAIITTEKCVLPICIRRDGPDCQSCKHRGYANYLIAQGVHHHMKTFENQRDAEEHKNKYICGINFAKEIAFGVDKIHVRKI